MAEGKGYWTDNYWMGWIEETHRYERFMSDTEYYELIRGD